MRFRMFGIVVACSSVAMSQVLRLVHSHDMQITSSDDAIMNPQDFKTRLINHFIVTAHCLSDKQRPGIPRISLGDSSKKETILVTGASGFLGQHIVKLLAESSTNVKEIRVFDTKPYSDKLGHTQHRIPITSFIGDIRKLSDVREAMAGVDSVVHTAGVISFGTFPDLKSMTEVNITGTANVIQACVEHDVSRLVYTSTVDVVIGFDDIVNGDESCVTPRRFLFPGYPSTKHHAEMLVNNADGRRLAKGDGSVLHTVCLRPNVMYGECDPFYVTNGLKSAKQNGGILVRVGDGRAKFQQTYVGNVAWCHLCAIEALQRDPDVGGRNFFVTDDTPLMNSFDFMEPFLELHRFSLSTWHLPYPVAYAGFLAVDWMLWALQPIYKINLKASLPSIIYVNKNLYFNRRRAEEMLGYKPIFDYQTSMKKSLAYYKKLKI